MVSIKEIAKQAGVSIATVSRVINSPNSVRNDKRQKVLACIQELNYKPNIQARNFRTQKSKNIIALVPNIRSPFITEVISGIFNTSKDWGYQVYIGTVEENIESAEMYISMLYSCQADGMLILSSSIGRTLLKRIISQFPIVLCNEYFADIDIDCVTIDNKKAAFDAVSYLYQRGYRNIAYIGGKSYSISTELRIQGYKEALAEYGLNFTKDNILYSTSNTTNFENNFGDILKNEALDGFVINSDLKAAKFIRRLKDAQCFSSSKAGIISFDGTYIAELSDPRITTITQPMYDIGQKSVELLVRKIESKNLNEPQKMFLPYEITVRDT
jgi:DNA-binding LacI/PurR family transcriptional regulator